MTTPNLETKVNEFLAEKRLAVAGVSRDNSHHPTGNLIKRWPAIAPVARRRDAETRG